MQEAHGSDTKRARLIRSRCSQKFLSTHATVYNTFNVQRHLTSAQSHCVLRAADGAGRRGRLKIAAASCQLGLFARQRDDALQSFGGHVLVVERLVDRDEIIVNPSDTGTPAISPVPSGRRFSSPHSSYAPEPHPREDRRVAQTPRSRYRRPSFLAQRLRRLPARHLGVGVRSVGTS